MSPAPTISVTALLMLLAIALARPAQAWTSPAPDVVLYTTPGLKMALAPAARAFRADTGVPVRVFAGSTAGLLGLIARRARDDVVIADAATIDQLAARNLVKPPRIPLGLDRYVLIATVAGAPAPGTALHRLLAERTWVTTDPTDAASFDGNAILHAILAADAQDAPGRQVIGVANARDALAAVRVAPDRIGLVRAADVAGAAGIQMLDTQLAVPPARIEAALTTAGQSRNAADFVHYLSTPPAQALLRQGGLSEAGPNQTPASATPETAQ